MALQGARGKVRQLSRPMIDEFGSSKSESRPILIYRNLPNGIETRCSKNVPTRVAIKLARESLGRGLWISEPENCVAGRLLNDGRGHLVQFRLLLDKDQHKHQLLDR